VAADDTTLPAHYDPHAAFARYAPEWEASAVFRADPDAPGAPYCIVIPPPNVTGSLHMGHALNNAIQDVLARWKRMDGFNVLWLPGTDHAGIATQWVVERTLRAQGIERRDLGRDAFLEHVWRWKAESGGTIVRQLKRLGVSCDWSRERFTMDEGLSRAVRENFVRLHEEGLIYRDTRLVNWDPVGLTALSDLEVETEENVQGELWSFAYPLSDGSGEIVVATTRPETMLGDTAVAVHPDDPRYMHLIGKTVRHPLLDRAIPIVGDAILVDPAFGTGAVKVTPAHDFNDHEVGKRHNLPMLVIFTADAKVNAEGGPYAGLDRFVARRKIKEDIAALGLDRGTKPHLMTLPKSQRSGAVVEPMVSTQWFMRMKPLATPAVGAVEHGFTTFHPTQWENTYYAWLRDVKDWCISRQLWWGHRIPAWHCAACGGVTVSREDATACGRCGSAEVSQDEDVLDTWFSSALWPFSTLGWPERTPDLARYYPTAVLVTGFDIIFFWVARMMFMGLHHMGHVPFKDVYIHGLVRDENGDKMSKTKGNVVDPLQAIEAHGADAFRMTLIGLAGLGRDLLWSDKRVETWVRFQNKAWQAYRFLHMHVKEAPATPAALGPMDRWILARAGTCVERVRAALDAYRFNDAAAEIYAFTWYELCDWYLEFSKSSLYGEDGPAKDAARWTLWTVFHALARMLSPFMPFFAEELWRNLPGTTGTCVTQAWPKASDFPRDDAALAEVALLQDAIVTVRRIRSEKEIAPRVPLAATCDEALRVALAPHAAALRDLAGVTLGGGAKPASAATAVVGGHELHVVLEGVLDVAKERERLDRELERVRKSVSFLEGRLGNEGFVARAPAALLEKSRAELAADRETLAKLETARAALA
jgi:valyl-tRNA synthetase